MGIIVISKELLLEGNPGIIESVLRNYQEQGNKIVFMTHEPKNTMLSNVSTENLGYVLERRKGQIDIGISNLDTHAQIPYDYFIYGNGIEILDHSDKSIYNNHTFSGTCTDIIIEVLRSYGYRSWNEYGSMPIKNLSEKRIYSFLTPEKATPVPLKKVYAVQCNCVESYYNDFIINKIKNRIPDIQVFQIDGKIVFFPSELDKVHALQKGILSDDINFEKDMHLVLTNPTEQLLADTYLEQTQVIGDGVFSKRKVKTLTAALDSII